MKRFFIAFFMAGIPSAALAAFAMLVLNRASSIPAVADVVCDITTGVATGVGAGTCIASPATCNGVADDAAAFAAFNAWATGTWQASHAGLIALKIPSGKNCRIASATVTCASFNSNLRCPFVNIKKMLFLGDGSAVSSLTIATVQISFSGMGLASDNLHSARTNTVTAGSSCVTLPSTPVATVSAMANNGAGLWRVTLDTTSGFVDGKSYYFAGVLGATLVNGLQPVQVIDATHVDLLTAQFGQTYTGGGTVGGDRTGLFTVGQYAMMGGFDVQGLWLSPFGFPPNLHYFEHVKVASKNSGTGQVCFDTALRNTYKSTWPQYNSGSAFQADAGGPATLYFLDASWDAEFEMRGLTVSDGGNPVYARSRSVIYRDVAFGASSACAIPTETISWSMYDSAMPNCNVEVDKLIGTMTIANSTGKFLKFQSSSTDSVVITNSTFVSIDGTPKTATISNAIIGTLGPGAFAYGRSDETICNACIISTLALQGISQVIASSSYTASGGVITFPNTAASGSAPSQRIMVPGTNIFFSGPRLTEGLFQVTDVTQDFTNTYVATSFAGGFPAITGLSALRTHPAPKFTCTNCTGSADVVSISSAPAAAPLYSYQTRTYTGAVGGAAQPIYSVWGNLSSASLNVTNAYSGSGSLTFHLDRFDNWFVLNSANANVAYGPAANAKIACNRTITLATVTGPCVPAAGDSGLATPDATKSWFTGAQSAGSIFSADVSAICPGVNCPSVTVIIQTDQGVVNP